MPCLLLPAPSTSHSFPVTYQYCHRYACSFVCHFQAGLLHLDPVLRSAARLIGRVSKFYHISAYMRGVFHLLPLRQRSEFRVAVLAWYSLRATKVSKVGRALACLSDLCCPSLSALSTRDLRSAEQGLFLVPFARTPSVPILYTSIRHPLFSFHSFTHSDQCCPTFLTPRAAKDIIMKPRAAPVN